MSYHKYVTGILFPKIRWMLILIDFQQSKSVFDNIAIKCWRLRPTRCNRTVQNVCRFLLTVAVGQDFSVSPCTYRVKKTSKPSNRAVMYSQLVMCGSFNLLKIIAESTEGRSQCACVHFISEMAKKAGHRLMTIIMSNLYRFKKFFHWKIP